MIMRDSVSLYNSDYISLFAAWIAQVARLMLFLNRPGSLGNVGSNKEIQPQVLPIVDLHVTT